jgi:hypothetical protein
LVDQGIERVTVAQWQTDRQIQAVGAGETVDGLQVQLGHGVRHVTMKDVGFGCQTCPGKENHTGSDRNETAWIVGGELENSGDGKSGKQ